MEIIQSEQNQWLKKCKALQQKKYRNQYNQFVAEGLRFVSEAIQNGAEIEAILVSEDQYPLLQQSLGNLSVPIMRSEERRVGKEC